ncbi:hypothetical protein [Sphingomonas bacterium]|uniref:hypothetical protein n=1 Tax=Sphingomonas bacterium TaxID=1895847 RepID=UPI0015773E68|nr:hypothetical protein [Sphingomonas bacterium]
MTDVRPSPAARTRASGLTDARAFFVALRPFFGGSIDAGRVAGITAKLQAFGAAGAPIAWVAYGLATSWWETAHTMQPVREIGQGRGCSYGAPGCHAGQVAYGRGDVQLTWDRNYERADRELGLHGALIADYNLALRPDISAQVLVRGMSAGWFTGRSLGTYLPSTGRAPLAAFVAARAIINGSDHAGQIGAVAMTFQDALAAGGWR